VELASLQKRESEGFLVRPGFVDQACGVRTEFAITAALRQLLSLRPEPLVMSLPSGVVKSRAHCLAPLVLCRAAQTAEASASGRSPLGWVHSK
jgi:hypothetical protein